VVVLLGSSDKACGSVLNSLALSCPLTRYVPQENSVLFPCNKSLIYQACSVKMAGYWSHSLFFVLMDPDSVSVHKHAKERTTNR